jgi:putative membrane protein
MKEDRTHKQADPQLDLGTRLDFERTYLAHERTEMAWVRTSLALISFGFAIAKFFHYLHEQPLERPPLMSAHSVGTLMIVIGLVALALASIQHGRAVKALRAQCPGLQASLAWVIASLLAALGILALVVVLLRE